MLLLLLYALLVYLIKVIIFLIFALLFTTAHKVFIELRLPLPAHPGFSFKRDARPVSSMGTILPLPNSDITPVQRPKAQLSMFNVRI